MLGLYIAVLTYHDVIYDISASKKVYTARGVARNLLRENKRGVWVWGRKSPIGLGNGSPLAGSLQGQSPSEGLGRNPQKPEVNANFQLRRGGGHAPMSSLGYAAVYRLRYRVGPTDKSTIIYVTVTSIEF